MEISLMKDDLQIVEIRKQLQLPAQLTIEIAYQPGHSLNIEKDGSLNYGFEVITHPATFNYHLSMMPKYR